MSHIRHLIEELRRRSDLGVVDEAQAWRICISKGRDFLIASRLQNNYFHSRFMNDAPNAAR
jgi:hypothetical protein